MKTLRQERAHRAIEHPDGKTEVEVQKSGKQRAGMTGFQRIAQVGHGMLPSEMTKLSKIIVSSANFSSANLISKLHAANFMPLRSHRRMGCAWATHHDPRRALESKHVFFEKKKQKTLES
jgi:hypothetical protein